MKEWDYHWASRQEILDGFMEKCTFKPRTELIPIREALGRVSAAEVRAAHTIPDCLASRMDGIAVRGSDFENGIPDTSTWQRGRDWEYVNTGVGLPVGFDAVVVIEKVDFNADGRIVLSDGPQDQWVCPPGKTLKENDLILKAHEVIFPQHIGLLATDNRLEVEVVAKPRVAILPTGSELVPLGGEIPRGLLVESNGAMIEAQVRSMGGEAHLLPLVGDDRNEITRSIAAALEWCDIFVLNGGNSKGSEDHSIEILEELSDIVAYEVDYAPGKHTMAAVAGGVPILGSVGHPGACECSVEWYVRPLIDAYLGVIPRRKETLEVRLTKDLGSSERIDFCIWLKLTKAADDVWEGEPLSIDDTAPIRARAQANLIVPKGSAGFKAGDMVEAELRYPVEWV